MLTWKTPEGCGL